MPSKWSKGVTKKVQQGKLTPEQGEVVINKLDLTEKFLDLFKELTKSPESRFTEETLRPFNIEVIPWDIQTSQGEPLFFQQMSDEDLQSYSVPEFVLGELLDPLGYCNAVKLQLLRCQKGAFNPQTDKLLMVETGWEGELYNYSVFHERGKWDNPEHRYEWGMDRLMGNETLPHSIALSTHVCDEPGRILRSELMIILLLMWAKGRLTRLVYDQITPVLLISIRLNHFRIIEAHHDGSKVVVRFSSPIPLEISDSHEKKQQTAHWVLRWLVAKPVGETKIFPASEKTSDGS